MALKKRICVIVVACLVLIVSGCASVPALIQDLGSDKSDIAEKAVQELGKRGDEAAPLVEEALENDSPAIRMNASQALYEIQGEDCAEYIVPLLNDEDSEVRDKAIAILQETGEAGVKEILAGADTYGSGSYYKSGAAVISALGKQGMEWMLEAYNGAEQPKGIAENMIQDDSGKTYENMLAVLKSRKAGDPLIAAAAQLFSGLDMESYQVIYQAYQSASGAAEKQAILELMVLMYSPVTVESVLNDMMARFMETEDFQGQLLEIYSGAGNAEKTMLISSVNKIEQRGSWLIKSLAVYYGTQDDAAKAAITELFSKAGTATVKTLMSTYDAESAARSLEIFKAMDKQAVVKGLSELLSSKDDFPKAAEYIEKLGYPEFTDAILSLPMEDIVYTDNLLSMLKVYAKDPRVDAKIKSLCASDYTFGLHLARFLDTDDYKKGLKVKTKGKGDGKQDKIVILENRYYEMYDYETEKDKAGYELVISTRSFDLIPADKQITLADTEPADTAVYIKTKLTRMGTYTFKTLGKKVTGYRQDFNIVIVDLRTMKVLGSKTLKGSNLPNNIYDTDVMWSVKRYLSEEPNPVDVSEAITALLEKYTD